MNIAYLSGAVLPSRTANSVNIVKMCESLGALGHRVMLFAPGHRTADIHAYYGTTKTFSVTYLPCPRLRYLGHIYGILAAISSRRMRVDLCIGRHFTACYFAALFGLPTVFDIHHPVDEAVPLARLLFRKLIQLPSFKFAVATTRALACRSRSTYPQLGARLIVAPNGADPPSGGNSPTNIAQPGYLNVGYTGHLYVGKGMEVISKLIRTCPFAYFHIVGGRDSDIGRWQRDLAGCTNVTFYGHIRHSEIPTFIAAFDVALLPNQKVVLSSGGKNIGDWTSPIKLFEYMAAGRAIVASDLPIIKEVLADRVNALLRDPECPDLWREALLALHNDGNLRERIGIRASEDFKANYTWQARAERVVKAANQTTVGASSLLLGTPSVGG